MVQTLTPAEFVERWSSNARREKASAQEHFIDLCRLVGVETPNEADPSGESYTFERGVGKVNGGNGWADVWRRDFFGWEYKGRDKPLDRAYQQLLQYREALDNPPLLIVSDMDCIEVHTNFTNTPATVYTVTLDGLRHNPTEALRILNGVMRKPEALRPGTTRARLTEEVAEEFSRLALTLRSRRYRAQRVARFVDKLVFCMFAEHSNLLHQNEFTTIINQSLRNPERWALKLQGLFESMATGGEFGPYTIEWFNGGLFDDHDVLSLTRDELRVVQRAATYDWSEVEPTIFGVLFERGLDPGKRAQAGAHYTDRESIERVVEPVLMAPLREEWESVKEQMHALYSGRAHITQKGTIVRSTRISKVYDAFLTKLRSTTVLDPACGSGNFLYVALQALKDLEKEVLHWGAGLLHKPIEMPAISPASLLGIEINTYAAELARIAVWIGEIQWMVHNGFGYRTDPILQPLDTVQCRDALLDEEGREAVWPNAKVIIGNPPFLGGKLLRTSLGDAYVDQLFKAYRDRVPREADLVCYWHEKARAMVAAGAVDRVGLLATQGIRGGVNRVVVERLKESGDLFMAWSDLPWVVEGASVHVSILGYDDGSDQHRTLDGVTVTRINANLTSGVDVTAAKPLSENAGIAFMGDTKGGPFDVSPSVAAALLASPNPDDRRNADVVRPWMNGRDIMDRSRGMWIIDFGDMPLTEAAMYEAPFRFVEQVVKPIRMKNRRMAYAARWWLHVEPRPAMRRALQPITRFIVTPTVSKHRVFAWADQVALPDHQLIVFARADDYFFGVLHSTIHERWARAMGTQLREAESGLRYTHGTTFETFPMPRATVERERAIAKVAADLVTMRHRWLNPAGASGAELRSRTLTKLYNDSPAWLRQRQEALDRAVHEAYGWPYPLDDEEILGRLLSLNHERSTACTVLSPSDLVVEKRTSSAARQTVAS